MRKSMIMIMVLLIHSAAFAKNSELRSFYQIDVDGDGKKDTLIYRLKKDKEDYQASLVIADRRGRLLWRHKFKITSSDMEKGLLSEEGNITVRQWVDRFFDGSLVHGARYEKARVIPESICIQSLDHYSKELEKPSTELRDQILSQEVNSIFYYQADWQKEPIRLVYLPKMHKFISYSGNAY